MAELKFVKEITALLVIDPYNDFIAEGGKLWVLVQFQTCGSWSQYRFAVASGQFPYRRLNLQ